MAPLKVIIIGGGLAGALLGNGLRRKGIDFMVYERDVKDSVREGYQIRLGAAALTGLRACLDESQVQQLMPLFGRAGGVISSAPGLFDTSFNTVLDLSKFPAYEKTAPISRVVLRNFLQKPLAEDGRLHYSKRFIRYEVIGSPGKAQRVRAFFEDGTSDDCDLLVSADGNHSKINNQIGLNNIVNLPKEWIFMAKGTLPRSRLLTLTPEVQKGPVICTGAKRLLYFSAYMPEATKLDNVATVKSIATEGITNNDNEAEAWIFWAMHVPAALLPEGGGENIPNKLQFCLDQIESWDPRYHDMLRIHSNEDDILCFQGRSSKRPAKNWRGAAKVAEDPCRGCDQVWLMGDAMHTMMPTRGMGGNQAMHDAADMLKPIEFLHKLAQSEHEPTPADFSHAVQQYESKMIPRSFDWVQKSSIDGETADFDSLKGKIMLFLVGRLLDLASLYDSVRRLFGWVPEDDCPEFRD